MLPRQIILVLSAFFILSAGCVTYHTSASQNFSAGGDSQFSLSERLALNPNLSSETISPTSMGGDISPDAGRMLVQGFMDYFSSGTYGHNICSHIGGRINCTVGADGGVQISGAMQPDGRFYIFNYTRDWLALKEVRNYTIRRVPLAGYFAYGNMSDSARADIQQQDLKNYLDAYIDQHISSLPEDTCIGDSPLDCSVQREDQTLDLNLTPAQGYPATALSDTMVLRTMCSFETADQFGESDYQSGEVDMSGAHTINQTISGIDPDGLRIPCAPGTPTLLVEVQYAPGMGIDTPYLLIYQLNDRERIQWQLHQGLLPNGSLMAAVSKYASGDFEDQVADFTSGQLRSHGFSDLNSTRTSEGLGADVLFYYTIEVPSGDVNGSVNGHTIDMSGNTVVLDLRHLAAYGTGDGVKISTVNYLSPLGPYTWLAINLIFLGIMGLVVLHGVMQWRSAPKSRKYMDRPDSPRPQDARPSEIGANEADKRIRK